MPPFHPVAVPSRAHEKGQPTRYTHLTPSEQSGSLFSRTAWNAAETARLIRQGGTYSSAAAACKWPTRPDVLPLFVFVRMHRPAPSITGRLHFPSSSSITSPPPHHPPYPTLEPHCLRNGPPESAAPSPQLYRGRSIQTGAYPVACTSPRHPHGLGEHGNLLHQSSLPAPCLQQTFTQPPPHGTVCPPASYEDLVQRGPANATGEPPQRCGWGLQGAPDTAQSPALYAQPPTTPPNALERRRSSAPRGPRRRAVVVGINYLLAPDILLRGCCNDASAVACALVTTCDFSPSEVILLVDACPARAYSIAEASSLLSTKEYQEAQRPDDFILCKDRQPTRRNILLALNWLRADAQPGDVLLFYFAGHGIQLDDMSGWEGEGYDEAILPMDFYGEEVNAITAVMIRNLLLSVAKDVQVTAILDCNGGQTMLDPAGTGTWSFIKGVKQRGVWPFVTDATDKVASAVYDPEPWSHPMMKKHGARPRFVPGAEIASAQELLDPTLQKSNLQLVTRVKGYLFAAAPWGQCAIEALLPRLEFPAIHANGEVLLQRTAPPPCEESENHAYHGVFTWCFLSALTELIVEVADSKGKRIPYGTLLDVVHTKLKHCVHTIGLAKLNQKPELTFYRSGGATKRDLFLWPFGGSRRNSVPYPASTAAAPRVVPPPIRSYLSTWEAEEQLGQAAQQRRANDPTLVYGSTRNPASVKTLSQHTINEACQTPLSSVKPCKPTLYGMPNDTVHTNTISALPSTDVYGAPPSPAFTCPGPQLPPSAFCAVPANLKSQSALSPVLSPPPRMCATPAGCFSPIGVSTSTSYNCYTPPLAIPSFPTTPDRRYPHMPSSVVS